MDIKEILSQGQSFFFEGMIRGWAADGQYEKVSDMPGFRVFYYGEGDFRLGDTYCVTPYSSKSAGTTTIWYKGHSIWVMKYMGFYEKSVIEFLKRVLLKTYKAYEFVGGRGPIFYSEGPLAYMNHLSGNNFANFRGREEIFNTEKGTPLGFHDYQGMSLLL